MDEKEEAQKQKEAEEREATEKAAKEKAELDRRAKEDAKKKERESTPVKSPLDEARDLDASIKKGNAEMKKLVERNEKAIAEAQISGKSLAGQPNPQEETADDKYNREAKERWKGAAMDPTPDDGTPTTFG